MKIGIGCFLVWAATGFAQTSSTTVPAVPHTGAHPVHRRTPVNAPAPAPCPPALPVPSTPAGLPPATGPVETAFALRYVDMAVGTGAPAMPGQELTVQYTGWLASDGTKFDSSLDHGRPLNFQQGAHRVIPGWDQGFGGMRVGGKRRLFIPYQLAYGADGMPPVIPPTSDLIFDIELVSVGGETAPAPPTE